MHPGMLQITNSVPLIPRCNVDELMLAIEAAPSRSSPPGSKSDQLVGWRSRSASAGSSLFKSSPLPPIPSNSSSTDVNSPDGKTSASTVLSGRPSSSHVTSSSWSSPHQPSDGAPSESFFLTEVIMLNVFPKSRHLTFLPR